MLTAPNSSDPFYYLIRLIFLPTLLTSIALIVGYSVATWFFFNFLLFPRISEDALYFWGPLLLPWLPLFLWLRPRYKLLKPFKSGKHPADVLLLLTGLTTGLLSAILVDYTQKAWEPLTAIASMSDIFDHAGNGYFRVNAYRVDMQHRSSSTDAIVSGKHNQNLTFNQYFIVPFITSPSSSDATAVFMAEHHSRQISNKLDDTEKLRKYRLFLKNSLTTFMNFDQTKVQYFQRIYPSRELDGFRKASLNYNDKLRSDSVFLKPIYEPFPDRTGDYVLYFIFVAFVALTLFLIIYNYIDLDETKVFLFYNSSHYKNGHVLEFLSEEVFNYDLIASKLIILMMVGAFCFVIANGGYLFTISNEVLIQFGASSRSLVEQGDYWRLFATIFLHGNVFHLAMNMIGLVLCSVFVERILGVFRFVILFLVCGVFGAMASAILHPYGISIGASGAVFGLVGCSLALAFIYRKAEAARFVFLMPTLILGVPSLLMWFFNIAPNMDYVAHLAGFLCGVICTIVFRLFERETVSSST